MKQAQPLILVTLATVVWGGLSGAVLRAAATPAPQVAVSEIPATAPVLHIDPVNGNDSTATGASTAPYKTITFALSRASGTTILQLAPGEYSPESGEVFPLHLKPGVILRGDESELGANHRIVGGGAYISPTLGRQSIAILADTGAEIRGVSIKNEGRRGYAVWVESAAPRIIANTFSGNVHDGIFFAGQSQGWVEGNRFYKNGANGISVLGTSTPIIVNNLFQETGFGITVDQRSSPRIENNRILKNRSGIIVGGSATPVIRSNWIGDNKDTGLVAITQAQPDLGSPASPGNNLFENNGTLDINNATRGGLSLVAFGNRLRPEAVKGNVEVGGQATQTQYVGSAPAPMSAEDLPAPPAESAPALPIQATPAQPQVATLPQPQVAPAKERIRILVTPRTPNDLAELQKRVPGAVQATLNGQPVLVAGLYDTRAQAMQVMDELAAAGFDAIAEVIAQ
ncbi:MAG: DUF1565 domain-containing protein [Thermostichales cyanobacterium DRC_bins_46]